MKTLTLIALLLISFTATAKTEITDQFICRAVISTLYNPKIEDVYSYDVSEGYIHVTHKTTADTRYHSKCKVAADTKSILWGNVDGIWRTRAMDEQISYEYNKPKLTIVITYHDLSQTKKEFIVK